MSGWEVKLSVGYLVAGLHEVSNMKDRLSTSHQSLHCPHAGPLQLDFVHHAKTAELARAGRLGQMLGGMGVSGLDQWEEEQEGTEEGRQQRRRTQGLPG